MAANPGRVERAEAEAVYDSGRERCDDGERFIERALSASVTRRLQARSLFSYLADLLAAHTRGDPLPTLT